jgi:hypothetical protein
VGLRRIVDEGVEILAAAADIRQHATDIALVEPGEFLRHAPALRRVANINPDVIRQPTHALHQSGHHAHRRLLLGVLASPAPGDLKLCQS